MLPLLFLAESDGVSVDDSFSNVDYRSLIVFGALALITLTVFIWAAFFRKRRRHRHHFQRQSAPPPSAEKRQAWSLKRLLGRKRRRHRRHRERRANPTRAETGGLPPIRADGSPPAID